MQILSKINDIIWVVASFLLLFSGIYFSFKLHFVQFNFKKMFKSFAQDKTSKDAITPKQALMMTLAGRVGVGSISGVALAIYTGGVGSIFWMWIAALIGVTNCFAETVLGIKYKEKDIGKIYKGGPSYYIKKGLNNNLLSTIYAVLIIICYAGGFTSIQANTIAASTAQIFEIKDIFIAIMLSSIVFIIIFGGIKKIANVTSKIVPLMIILYIGTGFIILAQNYKMILQILGKILSSAFNFKSVTGGFLGTFLIGIQRGIFSNEAGIGTGSIASSTVEGAESARQGYIQMLGVYITTLLVCTATAIIILTSDYNFLSLNDINGIEITQYAFRYHLGFIGDFIIFIAIVLFAFSTILTGYYYAESSLKSLFKSLSYIKILALKILIVLVVFMGTLTSPTILWKLVDILVALLAIVNVYALLKLRNQIKEEYNRY